MAASFTGNKAEAHPGSGIGDVVLSAFPNPTTAGACIVVIVRNAGNSDWDVASVTDSASNVYALVKHEQAATGDPELWLYRAKNIAGGTSGLVITVHQSSGSPRTFHWSAAAEFKDVDTTDPIADSGSKSSEGSGTATLPTAADVDSSTPGGIFVGGDSCPDFTTFSAGSVGGVACTLLYGDLGDSGGNHFGGMEYAALSGTLSGATATFGVVPNEQHHAFVWCVLTPAAGGASVEITGSGGVLVSGAATVAGNHTTAIAGASGIAVSGAATIAANHTTAITGSSGVRASGAAAVVRGRELVAAGGVRVGGAAGLIVGGLQSVTIVGAGGLAIAGAATTTAGRTVTIVGAGGVLVGTGTTVVRGVAVRGAGGARTGGMGTVVRSKGVVGFGGLRASGSAGIVLITGEATPPDVIVRVGADDVVIRMPADDTRVLT